MREKLHAVQQSLDARVLSTLHPAYYHRTTLLIPRRPACCWIRSLDCVRFPSAHSWVWHTPSKREKNRSSRSGSEIVKLDLLDRLVASAYARLCRQNEQRQTFAILGSDSTGSRPENERT